MADIFISYSSHDRPSALALVTKLRDAGYDVWIDQHQINAAARWSKEIVQAINTCKIFAILLSPSSLKSENVRKELSLAGERHKQLLPIFVEKVSLPDEFAYHLTGLQRVFIDNSDAIISAIGAMHSGNKSNDRLANQPKKTALPKNDTAEIRLAVLPFDDLSPAKDNEWFADGMVDELITTLGALETMKVPSRTDVMYYKKHHPKAQEIANDLNVRYLVGGSVRKAGDKIRITASLTDALANQQLWTSSYDGTFDDIFVFQETVSKQIIEALKLQLTPAEKKKIAEKPTENVEAYELYLRGRDSYYLLSRSGYEKAMKLFKEAIVLDPKFIYVYLVLASTYIAYYRECQRDAKWLDDAEKIVEQVENIGGQTAQTLWLKGEITWHRKNINQAETILKKSIDIDPNNELPYSTLGNIYFQVRKYKEAALKFEQALRIHERSVSHFNLLVCLSELNDSEQLAKRAHLAILFFEKELSKNPSSMHIRMMLAYAYHWVGQAEKAILEIKSLEQQDNLSGLMLFNIGGLYNLMGMPDQNIELIERAIEHGYREIEVVRNCNFEQEDHSAKLQTLIIKLEQLIKAEEQATEE